MSEDPDFRVRKEVLPSCGDTIVNFYLQANPNFLYRDSFLSLWREAYQTYLTGCYRASIILAGEALMRATLDFIIRLTSEGAEFEVSRSKRAKLAINADSPMEVLFSLADQLSFCDAIKLVEESNGLSSDHITRMYVVKSLRNAVVHGDLPVLDYWDPDNPRPKDQRHLLFSTGAFEPTEGYRFIPKHVPTLTSSTWYNFDPRQHDCGSLKPLTFEGRFAAIQLLLVLQCLAATHPPSSDAGNGSETN